jgi:dihydropyrimidine dehydrogenase (NAD+) subunit PreA
MHFGYRIVEDMGNGLMAWMRHKGYETISKFREMSLPNMCEW